MCLVWQRYPWWGKETEAGSRNEPHCAAQGSKPGVSRAFFKPRRMELEKTAEGVLRAGKRTAAEPPKPRVRGPKNCPVVVLAAVYCAALSWILGRCHSQLGMMASILGIVQQRSTYGPRALIAIWCGVFISQLGLVRARA